MKIDRYYQLHYEGKNDTGVVAKRNIRDYFLIISMLPDDLKKAIHDINDQGLVFGMINSHDYMYSSNYSSAVSRVNKLLTKHASELAKDPSLLMNIKSKVKLDRQATSNMKYDVKHPDNDKSFSVFSGRIQRLVIDDREPQVAIYRLIVRYGIEVVDKYLGKEHIQRDDRLHYTYRGLYDDENIDLLHYYEIEQAMYHCEYGYFAPMPTLDAEHQVQDDTQSRIIELWQRGHEKEAIDRMRTAYNGMYEETLEDFMVADTHDVLHLIQNNILESIDKINPDELLDSGLAPEMKKAERITKSPHYLWSGETHQAPLTANNVLSAEPLTSQDIADLTNEMRERVQED